MLPNITLEGNTGKESKLRVKFSKEDPLNEGIVTMA